MNWHTPNLEDYRAMSPEEREVLRLEQAIAVVEGKLLPDIALTRVGSPGADPASRRGRLRGGFGWATIKGRWKEMSGELRQQWGQLTDDDLQQVRGRRNALAGKIQHAYGISREEAERQIDDWLQKS